MSKAILRQQIVAEIMKLVRPEPVLREKPTITELEKLLNENAGSVSINTDGSVSVAPPPATVGDVADAVMRVIEADRTAMLKREHAEMVECLRQTIEFLRDPEIPFPVRLHDRITNVLWDATGKWVKDIPPLPEPPALIPNDGKK